MLQIELRTPGEPDGVQGVTLTLLQSLQNGEAGVQNLTTSIELTPEDRILTTAPLYHAYGFDLGITIGLKMGSTLYLEDEVSPARIVKVLREQEVNLLPGMPSL